MIYSILKWITGIALYWFYRDIRVENKQAIPAAGPLLIAVNHPNALVDALIAAWIIPRRVGMTAKATLTDNPLVAAIFRLLDVVPLRRTSDERERSGPEVDPSRNAGAFREILSLLERGGAVLIFPEGKSHSEAELAPLKSGLARLALMARDESGIRGLRILPMGLVFEDKGNPGSLVGARIGEPIEMDSWDGNNHQDLTMEIARRLSSMSNEAVIPATSDIVGRDHHAFNKHLIGVVAWWGRLTHRFPIRMARNLAVRRSTNPDEPAMLTIMFGLGFVLLTYVVHLAVIGVVAGSALVVVAYLVTLLAGAYWAAFEEHPRRY